MQPRTDYQPLENAPARGFMKIAREDLKGLDSKRAGKDFLLRARGAV
jgi:hypothetical protein